MLDFVHTYVVESWTMVVILVCVERIVYKLGLNNFIKMIMNAFLICGGMIREDLSNKLLCFGVDGVSIFQRGKIGVMAKERKDEWASFFMGVHFVVQNNLAIQSLFIIKIESS